VSLHPNCKKHLKKVPRLTQNTTCKGTFREHSGNIEGTLRGHSGNIQGTFREHSGNTQGTFSNIKEECKRLGNIQGTLREH
jgi:hypothetical protein